MNVADFQRQLEETEKGYLRDIENAAKGVGKITPVVAIGSYARFLAEIKGDNDRAMTFYERMEKAVGVEQKAIAEQTKDLDDIDRKLQVVSAHCIYLGSFAQFLAGECNDVDRA